MLRFPHRFFTFLFLLLPFGFVARAQNACECPPSIFSETNLRAFLHTESQDAQAIRQLTEPLLNAQSAICKARGYEFLAELALQRRQMDSVQNCLNIATEWRRKASCSDKNNWKIQFLWGEYFYIKTKFQESLDHYLQALSIAEQDADTYPKTLTLLKISQIFNRMKQSGKGMDYARQAVPFIEKMTPSVEKAYLMTLAAARFYYYYQDSKITSCLDSTFIFTKQAKALGQQFGSKKILILTYSRLENVETMRKNWQLGLLYNDSVLMHCDRQTNFRELYVAYGDRGDKYMDMGNLALAKQYADSAMVFAQKSLESSSIANILSLQYEIAKKMGDWQNAVKIGEQVMILTDSLQKTERTRTVNELEKKYNQAKNEKTIRELAQEKRIYLLLAVVALLLAAAIGFYLRQQALKHKHRILETEARLNRARMNPHFFFNALTSLQSFALRENDGKTLATNLSKFSNIMRETLESTYKEYVTIEQEMDFLGEYLEIQKIRFPQKFSYAIHADDDLEIDELAIPSMIIQPFVENSIEHGFAGLSHEGHIDIHFSKNKQEILIAIGDNGKGLTSVPTIPNEHISRASQIIKDRIYLLNLKLKTTARFSIENKSLEKGVLVSICLPVIFYENTQN